MTNEDFNLSSDPWIKVINGQTKQVEEVSLIELFQKAQDYQSLAGEMHVQDFAILRVLLAILHTVYSRYDSQNQGYDWLELDDQMQVTQIVGAVEQEDLRDTWDELFQAGRFSAAVTDYLRLNSALFDFYGERPFYQATRAEYDSLVPKKKQVSTGTGTVAVKQINRLVSESGNSPAIFSPKTSDFKDQVSVPELARWLITYQNFTGVTDKTKVVTDEKFSNPAGWSYRMTPVYAKGQNLFETLMLNFLILDGSESEDYRVEKPVWEYPNFQEYVHVRERLLLPNNLAELYTYLSRMIHLEWDDSTVPTIYSAGIPMAENVNAKLEPMTTWRYDTKEKPAVFKPVMKSTRSLGTAMWRNFGQYVNPNESDQNLQPGLVGWLDKLKEEQLITDRPITLISTGLVNDGNATSQAPVAEYYDDMTIDADVLFDDVGEQRWPVRIADTIEITTQVGKDYWVFMNNVSKLRRLAGNEFANRASASFYDQLNVPFKDWLASLQSGDDRDAKISIWNHQLWSIMCASIDEFMNQVTPRDLRGQIDENGKLINVLLFRSQLFSKVSGRLKIEKQVNKA